MDSELAEMDELSGAVIGAAIAVHREVGPGLLESVYAACLRDELSTRAIPHSSADRVPVIYKAKRLEAFYRIDLLVAGRLVVELKSVETVLPVHKAQLITYLKLGGFRRGLLINFNVTRLTNGIIRVLN